MDKETEPEKTGRAVHTTTMQRANDGQTRATQRSLPYAPSYVEELVAILEALTNPAIIHLTLDNLFTMVLLSNPVKYSPDGGARVVKSSLEGEIAHVIIKDIRKVFK